MKRIRWRTYALGFFSFTGASVATSEYKVDGFARLKMAQEVSAGLQRHKRAMNLTRDRERSTLDSLKGHEKFLVTNYGSTTWCKHIKHAFDKKELPNRFIVRSSNVFCIDCAKKIDESNGDLGKIKKQFVPVKNHLFEQLVKMYTTNNIDITYWNKL